jgi:mannose-6-phosphate isomerase-like protein (cupin superfamily)
MSDTQSPTSSQGVIVTLDEAVAIKPFGLDMQVLLSTEATGGKLSVLLVSHQPGEGPPDHLHYSQDECFFIVEGTYELTVDGTTRTVGAGAIVYLPRGTVHRFKNVGTTVAKMLDWSLPGGQDKYFMEIHQAAQGAGFSGEKIGEISKKHDTNFPAPH